MAQEAEKAAKGDSPRADLHYSSCVIHEIHTQKQSQRTHRKGRRERKRVERINGEE